MKIYKPPERTKTSETKSVLPRTRTVDVLPLAPVFIPENQPSSVKMAQDWVRALLDLDRVLEVFSEEEFQPGGHFPEFKDATWQVKPSSQENLGFRLAVPLWGLGRPSLTVYHHPDAFTKGIRVVALWGAVAHGLSQILVQRKEGVFQRAWRSNKVAARRHLLADVETLSRDLGGQLVEYREWLENKWHLPNGVEGSGYSSDALRKMLAQVKTTPELLREWKDAPPAPESLS